MTRPVDGIGPVEAPERRASDRRERQRRAGSTSRALVPVETAAEETGAPARAAATPPPDGSAAIFAAQMMGQTGQKRGLKGGQPVLDAARSAYLGTEYSGTVDRRPKPGRTEDTDI